MPDVKMIATGRSGSGANSGAEAPFSRSSGSTVSDEPAGGTSSVVMTTRGSARARIASRSRSESRSFTPAVIAPSFAIAAYARRYSGPGGRTSPTTSPTRTPRAVRPTATSSEMRSTSAYDNGQPSGVT